MSYEPMLKKRKVDLDCFGILQRKWQSSSLQRGNTHQQNPAKGYGKFATIGS